MDRAVARLRVILAGCVAIVTAVPLAALAGSRTSHLRASTCANTGQHTVRVHLVRGGPARTERGCLSTIADRYDYLFTAQKGAVLRTKISGAAVRLVATYPDGAVNGPGFPETSRLPQTGRYKIEVSPNQMAEGALRPFILTLQMH